MVRACILIVLAACSRREVEPHHHAGSDEASIDATPPCLPEPSDGGWSSGEYHFVSSYVADSIDLRMNDSAFRWELGGCDFLAVGEGRVTTDDAGVTLLPLDGGTFEWPGRQGVGEVDSVTLTPLSDGGFVAVAGDASSLWSPGTECGCGPAFHACTCEDPFEYFRS